MVPTVRIPNPAFHGDYDTARPAGLLSAMGPTTLQVKLGRVTPKFRRQDKAAFHKLIDPATAPSPPSSTDRRKKAMESIRRMYLNDQYGCCVISGKYHGIGVWTGNDTPSCKVVDDSIILQMYRKLAAVPGQDSGCVVTDVLDYWQRSGLPVGTSGLLSRIDGYVAADWRNKLEVQVAIYLFGRLTLAIDLPSEWASSPTVWDGPQSNIVGGHDIDCVDYNEDGVVISTWGGTRLITWSAFTSLNRNTELYAMVGPDWYNEDRLSPVGHTVESLLAKLKMIGGNDLPEIDPDTPPIPPSPPAPPVPPVPPAPPSFPEYAVALRGWFGTMTGTASPAGTLPGWPPAGLHGVAWLSLIQHVFQLVRHVQDQQWDAVDDDVLAILGDLGISISQSRMLTPDQWQQLVQAIIAFAVAILKALGKL